jgi:hypothetical protein
MRKVANEGFSKSAVKGFYETQNTEAVVLTSDLLIHPAHWDRHFRRAPASSTLSILYGNPTLKSEKDPIVVAITILPSVFSRLLLQVLTWFIFSPGCDISLAGECHQCIIITID